MEITNLKPFKLTSAVLNYHVFISKGIIVYYQELIIVVTLGSIHVKNTTLLRDSVANA